MFTFLAPDSKADMLVTLQKAIQQQHVVQFKLKDDWRTIEPYTVGYWHTNPQRMVVYGYSRDVVISSETPSRWQLFLLEEMDQLSLTAYSFKILFDYEDPTHQPNLAPTPIIWLPHGLKQPTKRTRLRR